MTHELVSAPAPMIEAAAAQTIELFRTCTTFVEVAGQFRAEVAFEPSETASPGFESESLSFEGEYVYEGSDVRLPFSGDLVVTNVGATLSVLTVLSVPERGPVAGDALATLVKVLAERAEGAGAAV